ncbi:MAG TPA: cellulase family glycosylhydrolase [Catalimonadaceae bacterium]|nr:cellulase family glycosylhydrolase [Catalimonadaceae bacterium]
MPFFFKQVKVQILVASLLFSLQGFCQINRVVFHEDFENTSTITSLWGLAVNYSVTTGVAGNGLLFNSTTTNTNLTVSTPISMTNLVGRTIGMSASIKGENLTGGGNPGMVIQLVGLTSTGSNRYYRIPVSTGTFDWKPAGRSVKIHDDVVSMSLNIGIYNASGKFWLDDLHIQVIAEPLPPARDPTIVIDKTHPGMYRGMNVRSNTITKNDLDELRTDWKANTIRCQIGGNQFADGLLLSSFDSILQTELLRMDTLVSWCTANGLRMNVGLAGLSQGLFNSKVAQTRLVNTWKMIALRYQNKDAVWAYDLANEPINSTQYPHDYVWPLNNEILLWPSLADTLVKAIRSVDPQKAIIIESLNYSLNVDDIRPIDFNIPNIIYSVHMYEPHPFTHQQITGPTPAYSYPGSVNGKYFDKDTLKKLLKPLKDYQQKYRVPIYIGEFSAIRWSPNNSAYNYLRDCIEIFEEYEWDWNYHAFRDWDGWSVEHSTGYYDPVLPATMTDRELLLRSYFLQNITGVPTFETKNQSGVCYPNPATDEVSFNPGILGLESGFVEISDALGRLNIQKQIRKNEVTRMDIRSLSDGIYFYRIQDENGKSHLQGKLLKHKN